MARKPARIQIPLVVETILETEISGKKVKVVVAVNNAEVTIARRDGKPTKVYESETGGEISPKVKTNSAGQISAWVEEGPYKATAEKGSPEITPTEYSFDIVPGRGVESLVAIESGEEGIVPLLDLVKAVQGALVPVGAVLAVPGPSAPTGFLLCEGGEFKSSEYSALSSAVGEKYGKGAAGFFVVPKLANLKATVGELVYVIKF